MFCMPLLHALLRECCGEGEQTICKCCTSFWPTDSRCSRKHAHAGTQKLRNSGSIERHLQFVHCPQAGRLENTIWGKSRACHSALYSCDQNTSAVMPFNPGQQLHMSACWAWLWVLTTKPSHMILKTSLQYSFLCSWVSMRDHLDLSASCNHYACCGQHSLKCCRLKMRR